MSDTTITRRVDVWLLQNPNTIDPYWMVRYSEKDSARARGREERERGRGKGEERRGREQGTEGEHQMRASDMRGSEKERAKREGEREGGTYQKLPNTVN
jgi:hypothetical protein